jgi:nitrite reductase/ring-hydroxylating ferredoxin subunit
MTQTSGLPEVGTGPDAGGASGSVRWIRACAVDAVEPGEAVAVDSEPAVAVFNVEGDWYATDELCSWHFAKFCLLTGAALTLPATVGIRTYPTKVEDGVVYVGI